MATSTIPKLDISAITNYAISDIIKVHINAGATSSITFPRGGASWFGLGSGPGPSTNHIVLAGYITSTGAVTSHKAVGGTTLTITHPNNYVTQIKNTGSNGINLIFIIIPA